MSTRRDFLRTTTFAAGGLAVGGSRAALAQAQAPAQPAAGGGKMLIGVFNDHLDWMWTYGNWSNMGTRYYLQRYQQAGIKRCYLRTHDGSLAQYPSKVTTPYRGDVGIVGTDPLGRDNAWYSLRGQGMDCTTFDPLKSACDQAAEFGVEMWFYPTPLLDSDTGNGWYGEFAKAHPEWYRVFRDGKVSDTNMSWAFPEVMEYKLATIRELLQYNVKGILLDLLRQHTCWPGWRLADENGACLAMYEKPVVDAFKAKTGRDPFQIPNDDPDWIRFRADYNTDYIRRVRQLINEVKPGTQLGVMVRGIGAGPGHKGDAYRECLLDVTGWANEGLIDLLMGDQWATRERTPEQIAEQVRVNVQQVAGTNVKVGLELCCFEGKDVMMPKIERGLPAALEAGASEVSLYECVVFEGWTVDGDTNAWKDLGKVVGQYQA